MKKRAVPMKPSAPPPKKHSKAVKVQPKPEEPSPTQTPVNKRDENMWAMFCHLSTFAGLLVPMVGNIVGPLVIWSVKKDEFPLVNDQGKEALNFQISMTIYYIGAIVLTIVVIGVPILIGLFLFDIIITIVAMVKAGEGVAYRYPLCIRFIS
ncbi:MAG: DUF4870 domain-containing protein [Bacteroidota bacterium]